jgi:hypothetical protein
LDEGGIVKRGPIMITRFSVRSRFKEKRRMSEYF